MLYLYNFRLIGREFIVEFYIEYVLLDNILITYFILKLIDITTGICIKNLNKLIVCIMGSVFAIFLPFLSFNKFIIFIYRIFVSIILVLCIRKFKKFKSFAVVYLLFMTYTFLAGGVCFGLINLLGIEYTTSNLIFYSFEFPISIFIIIFLLMLKLIFRLVILFKIKVKKSNYLYNVTLVDGEKTTNTIGFFDTGNNIMVEGCGVNIISISLFLKLYQGIDITQIFLKKEQIDNLKNIKYIHISGIGDGDKYLTFIIDKMKVDELVFENARIAVAMKNFEDYDLILHNQYIRGIG